MGKIITWILAILLLSFFTAAADTAQPEMADIMRSNGKIYVVVMVMATIFAGIIAFLIYLDRKITKLEKNQ